MTNKDLTHYMHLEIKGNYKNKVRKLGKELGLEKRFMRKIFEGDGMRIKYGCVWADSHQGVNSEIVAITYLDLYSENIEKAKIVHDKIKTLMDNLNNKTGIHINSAMPEEVNN